MQENKKTKGVVKIPLVRKVSIPDTLALIPRGSTARFTIKDMKLQSVRAMASFKNKRVGRKEYEVIPYENGAVFDVVRH